MKCLSCDTILTDSEATRKFSESGTFVDLCDNCFAPIADDVLVTESGNPIEDLEDEE